MQFFKWAVNTKYVHISQVSANAKPQKLSKFAAAAGKKMRKLRRNWSLKKSDISRSLSKIRRPSLTGAGVGGVSVLGSDGGQNIVIGPASGARRNRKKAARSRDGTLVHRGPSFKAASVVQSDESTMFYITLNIEDVNGQAGEGTNVTNVEDGSCKFRSVLKFFMQ